MTNVNNTSGKSDGRVSVYEVENYTGFKVFIVLLVLAIVALVALFANIKASHAASMDERSNACRTYHVFAHQKANDQYAETDGEFCGTSTESTKHTSKDVPATVITEQDNTKVLLDTDTNTTPIVDDDTESNDTPVVTAPIQGNPGNDKPVGSAGEKCDKGMCENSDGQSGEHGNSNND